MKKINITAIIFILLSMIVLIALYGLGYSELIYSYSMILVFISYFAGKYAKSIELRRQQKIVQ